MPRLSSQEVNLIYDKSDRSAGLKNIKVNQDGVVNISVLGEGGAMFFQDH